ncbi:MAG TPA: bifunctional glycosyltransferase family 2/GtrA family protein [Stellaceae bacterium]|nr:bifunctional glycosyltransferase family 2/GtrA family protein [Stellaceae bacterium]
MSLISGKFMKEPISLTIFLPAYNEEENIKDVIEDTIHVAEESPYIRDYEILLINDGSTDKTQAIAEQIATWNEHIHVITHECNRGYGAALRTGLDKARKEWIFFTDADRQFDVIEIQNLILHIPKYDVVIGYRAPRRDSFLRLVNAKIWNMLNRILFGLRVRDIDCAFKLVKRKYVQDLQLLSYGAMINAEILIRLKQRGVHIKEVPVSHLPRRCGSPTGAKPSVILRALRELVMLYGGELGSVTHKQALKFMMVGIINTLVDAIFYIGLTREIATFSMSFVAAKFVSFLGGTISSLILNRWWTFGVRTHLRLGEVLRFYATVSLALSINLETMNFLVRAGLYDLCALPLTSLITFTASFTLSKFWVFRKDSRITQSPFRKEGEWPR